MTEKRFVNKGKDIFQYGEWWCSGNGEHCADVIATAMNELCEENEQLKKSYDISEDYNDSLSKENEELHQIQMELVNERDSLRKENTNLFDENEQLKTELKAIREERHKEFMIGNGR